MARFNRKIALSALALLIASCSFTPQPPIATPIPYTTSSFGNAETDNYQWLQNSDSQNVVDYLIAENNYTQAIMEPTLETQKTLYNEMLSRSYEVDETVPIFQNGYYYYIRFEKGKELPINCRRKGKIESKEEIILDENEVAAGHEFCNIASLSISPNNKILAYAVDTCGNRQYTILLKDLQTGLLLKSKIENTSGAIAWANDNATIFYAQRDKSFRLSRILKHNIDEPNSKNDKQVYYEADTAFAVNVFTSKSKEYILISSINSSTTEYQYLNSNTPNAHFKVFQPRIKNHEYHVYPANNRFYIKTNWDAPNFRIMEASKQKTDKRFWREVVSHNSDICLLNIEIFRDFMVMRERNNALIKTRIHKFSTGDEHYIDFGEEAYTTLPYENPEFSTNSFMYDYTSLTTPITTFEYNMLTRERKILKQNEILNKYSPRQYKTQRLWASSADGTKVPISIIYKNNIKIDGQNPMLIYGFGAFGYTQNPIFDPTIISLVDRGFVYAIAHVRGGNELGNNWHTNGCGLNKKNAIDDFIACTNFLVEQKYAHPDKIIAQGNGAGGLIMGVIINSNPNLYHAIIAEEPLVDIMHIMFDTINPPQSSARYEWGNPCDSATYQYIKSYSPYQQVTKQQYPNMLITTNFNKSQGQHNSPVKWAAKLRANSTSQNLILLKADMNAESNAYAGRQRTLENKAFIYTYILHVLNMD